MTNTFKHSKNRWLTKGLFYEASGYDIEFAQFTLDDEDKEVKGKKLLSIKRLFLSSNDPTEYEFATKHLGGWAHWKAIQGVKDLEQPIQSWRDELEVKIRSEAIRKIAEHAESDKGYQAAKFLADRGWDQRKAGAPSKAERAGHKKVDQVLSDSIQDDYERVRNLQ